MKKEQENKCLPVELSTKKKNGFTNYYLTIRTDENGFICTEISFKWLSNKQKRYITYLVNNNEKVK